MATYNARKGMGVCASAALVLCAACFTGCAVFDVAGSVVGATGDIASAAFGVVEAGVQAPVQIVEAVVEVPVDIATSASDAVTPDFRVRHELHRSWTVDAEGISSIEVVTGNAPIVVEGADSDEIRVRAHVTARSRSDSHAEQYARGVELHVGRHGDVLRVDREIVDSRRDARVSVRFELEVPATVDLNLRSSNGQITVAHVDGIVNARTSNGRIYARHSHGDFELHTSNGKIQLDDCSGHIHAQTSNGAIEATLACLDNGVFVTSNGSVRVKVYDDVGSVGVTTRNGAIELALPVHFQGHVDARTSNGKVHSEFPVSVTEAGKHKLIGTVGTRDASEVELRTSNASIRLKKAVR